MKSTFFKVVFSLLLVLGPTKAMDDSQEETAGFLQVRPIQQKAHQEEIMASAPDKTILTFNFPNEILLTIFRFLAPHDLGKVSQVSHQFKENFEDSALWRHVGLKHYGDFLTEVDLRENLKQNIISHYLSVIVNATLNLEKIERIVNQYKLKLYIPPFIGNYIGPNFLTDFVTDIFDYEQFIAQENKEFIERKIEGLSYGRYGYEKDRKAAREFIDSLVKKDNLVGIKKKAFMLGYRGSIDSCIGYELDLQLQEELDQLLIKKGDLEFTYMKIRELDNRFNKVAIQASRDLNEQLVEKGDLVAIERKIEGLSLGKYGYEKDPVAATELNDILVEQGDAKAMERKIVALSDAGYHPLPFRGYSAMYTGVNVPAYGYEKDPVVAREFNDLLVERGDPEAVERKIKGLLGIATGKFSNPEGYFTVNLTYGYKKDLEAAREFNEQLAQRGSLVAIERKIKGLTHGEYGYKKHPTAAREFNEQLVERGDLSAIDRKAKGLAHGEYGYEKDPAAAREFNEQLVERGYLSAIERKIKGLTHGGYGYEKDPTAAKEFIENLVISDFTVARAIGKYLKAFALKYGVSALGYEKDHEKAIILIRKHHVPY